MLAEFSSYIEFLAAVYVTMTINNDFCSKFWTPDNTEGFKKALTNYQFDGSSSVFDGMVKDFNTRYVFVESLSHKKGAVMLILCIIALVILGFEESLDNKALAISFYLVAVLSFILLVFPKLFIQRWERVIISMIVIGAISLLGYNYSENLLPHFESFKWIYHKRKVILVLFLIWPIIYQLFINWLHSNVYLSYLDDTVKREFTRYQKSKQGIHENNRDMVAPEYFEAYGTAHINNDGQDSENTLTEVLRTRLTERTNPSYCILIKWEIYKILHKLKRSKHLSDTPQNIVRQSISDYVGAGATACLDFSKEYEKFNKMKKAGSTKKLKDFCKAENINFKDMCAWLRVFNRQSKS